MYDNRISVLVLGGTGAIGTDLVDMLAARNCTVSVTSRSEHVSCHPNVSYIKGNAKVNSFLVELLKEPYDVIVDFMSYGTEEFKTRADMLLSATGQYIFISSARVYAESACPLTEESPRLLDICDDRGYLATDEYALAKARQEDFLHQRAVVNKNYTIVRPSLTYNSNRIQFAISEKEEWLYRALHGKSIIFPKDMEKVRTTMGYGKDVAAAIASLIGNPRAIGETVQIAGACSNTWQEILEIYQRVLEEKTGCRAKVFMAENSLKIAHDLGRVYQIKYARRINRTFDCTKLERIAGKMSFTKAEDGLKICLRKFFDTGQAFKRIDARVQGYFDKIAKEYLDSKNFPATMDKAKYVLSRYTPYFEWREHITKARS